MALPNAAEAITSEPLNILISFPTAVKLFSALPNNEVAVTLDPELSVRSLDALILVEAKPLVRLNVLTVPFTKVSPPIINKIYYCRVRRTKTISAYIVNIGKAICNNIYGAA